MSDPTPPSVRNFGVSWLRTVVPTAWGALVTFLLSRAPELHDALVNPGVTMAVTGAVVTLWYSLFRAIENKLPPWLTAFVIGSNATPKYFNPNTLKSRQPSDNVG
jgi:hypothetical protein